MSQLREAVAQGREAFHRELTKRGTLVFFLQVGGVVAAVNLVKAYEAHSISDAVKAVVLWLVLFPLLGRWMYPRKSG